MERARQDKWDILLEHNRRRRRPTCATDLWETTYLVCSQKRKTLFPVSICIQEKSEYLPGDNMRFVPAATATVLEPLRSCCTASCTATREELHAVSIVI